MIRLASQFGFSDPDGGYIGDEADVIPPMFSLADGAAQSEVSRLDVFHGYMGVLLIAFVVTLVATPIMRRLALANGIVDRPSDPRKIHQRPTAYLGGVAVYLGLMAGIFASYMAIQLTPRLELVAAFHPTEFLRDGLYHFPVPISVLLGMTIIMLLGLYDDVMGISPRLKVAGMFVAAAALALEDVGVRLAEGLLAPTLGALLNNPDLVFTVPLPMAVPMVGEAIGFDLVYWTGTAIIALFVLGACNASNLIDGLDGLLTGTTAIAAVGLMLIALSMAVVDDGPRDAQRLILCMALLGACMGFLPHNFNPASIFLGDSGSLLLGFTTIVVVLTLGDTGQTHLVLAGLVIYAIPIIDTVLAIVRRKLAGKSISEADDQHLHHMLKRALGVRGAVFTIYGLGVGFAAVGVAMSIWRVRVAYAIALLFLSYVIVFAIKSARRVQIESAAAAIDAQPEPSATVRPTQPAQDRPPQGQTPPRTPAPTPAERTSRTSRPETAQTRSSTTTGPVSGPVSGPVARPAHEPGDPA